MKANEFTEVVHNQFNTCELVLGDKAAEYATDDRLHNFKISAQLQGISPKKALAGMMAKHTTSIYDMCASDIIYPADKWDEKITDHINYLVLLKALIIDQEKAAIAQGDSPVDIFLNSIGPE